MALRFPDALPEPYRLPVIAAEATARTNLEGKIKAQGWKYSARGERRVDEYKLRPAVVQYLCQVCETFSEQACNAVRDGAMRFALLDSTMEEFVPLALFQAYYGLNNDHIRFYWRTVEAFGSEMTRSVMSADWHTRYLQAVPAVLAELSSGRSSSPSEDNDSNIEAKARRRRDFVLPRLGAKGFSASAWAIRAGVAKSAVGSYLRGQTMLRPESRRHLAVAIGVQPSDLPD